MAEDDQKAQAIKQAAIEAERQAKQRRDELIEDADRRIQEAEQLRQDAENDKRDAENSHTGLI